MNSGLFSCTKGETLEMRNYKLRFRRELETVNSVVDVCGWRQT